jgi:hypothetical protein
MSYYQVDGVATIDWDITSRAARITWSSFNVKLDQFKNLMAQITNLLKSRSGTRILVDTSAIQGALPQVIIDDYAQNTLPQFMAMGVKFMATVIPKSAVGKLSTKIWQSEQVGAITMLNVDSVDEAREWLRQQR